jgi:hypothetical protein
MKCVVNSALSSFASSNDGNKSPIIYDPKTIVPIGSGSNPLTDLSGFICTNLLGKD